jgi:hypothetical protein
MDPGQRLCHGSVTADNLEFAARRRRTLRSRYRRDSLPTSHSRGAEVTTCGPDRRAVIVAAANRDSTGFTGHDTLVLPRL